MRNGVYNSVLIAAGVAAISGSLRAESVPRDYGEIQGALSSDPLSNDPLIETPDWLDGYYKWKQDFAEQTGFNYLVEYGVITQWGSRGPSKFHADHELNLIGMWDVIDSPDSGQGRVIGWFQNSLTLGADTTTVFRRSQGILSPPNGGDTFPDHSANRLQHLAWEQRFVNERIRLMAGKLTTRILINQNRYAVSDREDFFTPMVVNNPVVPYTARIGLGVFGEYREDRWYASALVRDADATADFIDIDSLDTGNWEYAGEVGLTPEVDGLGEGNYRITGHYTDSVGSGASYQPSGWSFSASFDQDIGESVGAFFRYAWADNPLRAFEQRVAAGAQIMSPFEHPDDRIGIAGWWGEPSDSSLRDEYGLEVFYRVQLTRTLQVTPDVQLIFDPALDPTHDVAFIGGLRARLEF